MVILAWPEIGKLWDGYHFLLDGRLRLAERVSTMWGRWVTVILWLNGLLVHMLGDKALWLGMQNMRPFRSWCCAHRGMQAISAIPSSLICDDVWRSDSHVLFICDRRCCRGHRVRALNLLHDLYKVLLGEVARSTWPRISACPAFVRYVQGPWLISRRCRCINAVVVHSDRGVPLALCEDNRGDPTGRTIRPVVPSILELDLAPAMSCLSSLIMTATRGWSRRPTSSLD